MGVQRWRWRWICSDATGGGSEIRGLEEARQRWRWWRMCSDDGDAKLASSRGGDGGAEGCGGGESVGENWGIGKWETLEK
ncbi:hypothetical protein Ddye_008988 [Dipteronia dyeriana]|uniref:Uncharacterized protein n=1 Tax=Dipteronia dyeriana TaxID=168575 RepID=A0AAD9XAH9_9ROSI|nr:hypothetical protein Ddye_008988 [Dipteronia dyeriana]